jgi:hypothetical protein
MDAQAHKSARPWMRGKLVNIDGSPHGRKNTLSALETIISERICFNGMLLHYAACIF